MVQFSGSTISLAVNKLCEQIVRSREEQQQLTAEMQGLTAEVQELRLLHEQEIRLLRQSLKVGKQTLESLEGVRSDTRQLLVLQQALAQDELFQRKIEELIYQTQKAVKVLQAEDGDFTPSQKYFILRKLLARIEQEGITTSLIRGLANKAAFDDCIGECKRVMGRLESAQEVKAAILWVEQQENSRNAAYLSLIKGNSAFLYVTPNLPDKKLNACSKACGVPVTETVVGFHWSSGAGIVFGCEGVYFCNPKESKQEGAGFLSFDDLLSYKVESAGFFSSEVSVGKKQYINPPFSKDQLIALLVSIQDLLRSTRQGRFAISKKSTSNVARVVTEADMKKREIEKKIQRLKGELRSPFDNWLKKTVVGGLLVFAPFLFCCCGTPLVWVTDTNWYKFPPGTLRPILLGGFALSLVLSVAGWSWYAFTGDRKKEQRELDQTVNAPVLEQIRALKEELRKLNHP